MGDSVLDTRTQTADSAWPKHFQLQSHQRQRLVKLRWLLLATRFAVAGCLVGALLRWTWLQPGSMRTWRDILPLWIGASVFWVMLFSWLEPRLTLRVRRIVTACGLTERSMAIHTAWRTERFEWSHVLDIEQVPRDHLGRWAGLAVLRLMPSPAREDFFLIDPHMQEQERLLRVIEGCSGIERSPTDRITFWTLRTQSE